MKLSSSKVGRTIDDYLSSRRTIMLSNVLLGVVCVFLTIALLKKNSEVIAIPPGLTEAAVISGNKANEAYNLTWATHIAGIAGNISPASAEFIKQQLKTLLSPRLQQEVGALLDEEIELLGARNAAQQFIVEDAIYDATNNLSWIWGRRILQIPGLDARVSRWTYEIQIEPHNGMPRITYLNAYQGAPNRRQRARGQNINPFLTIEQESAINSNSPNTRIIKRELPGNVGPAVEVELNEGDSERINTPKAEAMSNATKEVQSRNEN